MARNRRLGEGWRVAAVGGFIILLCAVAMAILFMGIGIPQGRASVQAPNGIVPVRYGLAPGDVAAILPGVSYILNFSSYTPLNAQYPASGGYIGMYTESFIAEGINDTSSYPYSIESDIIVFSNSTSAAAYTNSILAYDSLNSTVQGGLGNATRTEEYQYGGLSTTIYTATSVAVPSASLIQPNINRAIYYSASFFHLCNVSGLIVTDGYIELKWNLSIGLAEALLRRISQDQVCG